MFQGKPYRDFTCSANMVSYNGAMYAKQDIDNLWKHLERYRTWGTSAS